MTYTENLWLYFTLLFGIIMLPGIDMLLVLASSLTGGRRVGLAATSGIIAGGAVHSLYGAIGIALLATIIPVLFTPLMIFGAAYMIWIGFSLIRSSIVIEADEVSASASAWRAFRRGVITCLSNPKALSLHDGCLPSISQTRLWSDMGSRHRHGADDCWDSTGRLWHAGANRWQKP